MAESFWVKRRREVGEVGELIVAACGDEPTPMQDLFDVAANFGGCHEASVRTAVWDALSQGRAVLVGNSALLSVSTSE